MIQPFHLPEKIQIGKALSVTCAVMSGKSPFIFKWYKDGSLLQTENTRSESKKVSTFVIDPILETSGGNYTCVISNSIGKDQFSSVLTVKGIKYILFENNLTNR